MLRESTSALPGRVDAGPRFPTVVTLVDLHKTCLFENPQMSAEIAVGEIEDFVAAVKEGRDPEVSGDEGARNVNILLEAIR